MRRDGGATRRGLLLATPAFVATSGLLGSDAHAQDVAWPDRPVRFLVAFAPGGPADIIARLLAQALSETWPFPAVVENRGGAGGNIAAQQAARARPDGSLALVTTSAFAVNPGLSRRAGYTPEDFVPASIVAATPNLFCVRPQNPARTLAEFVDNGKRAGKLDFGSAGIGTTPHLSAENLLRLVAGAPAQHIPFTGAGPALAAVIGGQIDMASVAMPAAVEMVRAGTVRALAVTAARRTNALPDVPTVAEAGFQAVDDVTWVGVFLPAATPAAITQKANADINRLLANPAFQARLDQIGFSTIGGDLASAQRFVAAEVTRWGGVVRALGVEVE